MKKIILTGLLCLLASCIKADAVTIINGSFEDGYTGWYVTYGNVDLLEGYWIASDGTHSVDMSGNTAGGIAQVINTVIGQEYQVSFDLSGNPDGLPTTKTLTVSTGYSSQTYTYSLPQDISKNDMKWQTQFFNFTAEKDQTELSFSSLDYSCFGAALDNVKITEYPPLPASVPTPEPSSLLLGFTGLTGLLGLKKRK